MVQGLTRTFRIEKDPEKEGEWSSVSDVGKEFGGAELTWDAYLRVEEAYLRAIRILADAYGVTEISVRHPEAWSPLPGWLTEFRDGTVLSLETAVRVARAVLRESGIFCHLVSEGRIDLSFGRDYTVYADVAGDPDEALARIRGTGLDVLDESASADPFRDVDDDEFFRLPADADFWLRLSERIGRRRGRHLLLERWAQGTYGQSWYALLPGDSEAVRRRVRPRSQVFAFFDVDVFGPAKLRDRAGSLSEDDVDDLEPWIRAVPAEPPRLETEYFTDPESVTALAESAGTSAEAFFFVHPGLNPEGEDRLVGVVPDPDGRVRGRWPAY
ncbi:hypothetical protein HDA32_004306 [Spinactinospora alkalitolerans]|uniref:Uncharacterized protein n=1 Tax=Spinactinospora alkalitolerans TaxID=687207 RepID=A0A852TXF9_9ACTN|nr:hypothetical protein [Spinactinospora alkalitolerans]NYE49186.1 hypothetical protein [Spinactinospora alkalitolerans]